MTPAADPGDRYVVWDVETLRLSHEVPGGWRNIRGFGLAVAVTEDSLGATATWEEHQADKLIDYLRGFPLIVGFNNRKFDNQVLSAYGDVTELDIKSLDLLEDISRTSGKPHCVSLDRLSEAVLGERKLMDDPTEAVRLWRSGKPENREFVVRYCQRDVELTRENFLFGRRHGYVLVPLDEMRWGNVPLVAKVPVDWGRPASTRQVQPQSVDL